MRDILTVTSSPDDDENLVMARPRALPPGIRPRGRGYVYDWRDATGRTSSRKAGETIPGALAFNARIVRAQVDSSLDKRKHLPCDRE